MHDAVSVPSLDRTDTVSDRNTSFPAFSPPPVSRRQTHAQHSLASTQHNSPLTCTAVLYTPVV